MAHRYGGSRSVGLLLLVLLVSGCVNVRGSKTMTIPPAEAPVTVTTTARVKCWDILFLFFFCNLNMEMESSTGQRVSDFQ